MPKKLDLTENLEKYIIEHSESLTDVQKEIIQYNISLGDQKRLQISVSQAQFLQTLIKISNIKKILEIGSFTGFSALSMALALPSDGLLISLDKSSEFSMKAQSFYEKANEKKIKQIIRPAIESLKELKNSSQKFDLIFIDADKNNYPNYYELSLNLLVSNGIIIIDNMLWHGDVADETKQDSQTKTIRDLNLKIQNDTRVEFSLLPLSDGLSFIRKK